VYCVWQVVKTPTIILNNPVQKMPLPFTVYSLSRLNISGCGKTLGWRVVYNNDEIICISSVHVSLIIRIYYSTKYNALNFQEEKEIGEVLCPKWKWMT
jgi:hypothetical protein